MNHTPPRTPGGHVIVQVEDPPQPSHVPEIIPMHRAPEVARISMRAPPFWKENPALWFVQLESQFITNGVTVSDTKYHIAVAALETSVINQVSDVVLNPPALRKYETLKQRLQERFTESEEKKFKKLLGAMDIGDKLPSHLWREMRELAGDRVGDDLLKSLWLQRLQPHAQAILSTSDGNMVRLTEMADKIHEVIDTRGIHSVSSTSSLSTHSEVNELRQQILALTKQMSALTSTVGDVTNQRARSSGRSQSRGRRQRSSSRVPGLCWYHDVFGENANKCTAPCSFVSSKN